VGEVVDRVRVQELPLNGRNAMELARIVPGVARTSAPTAITQAQNSAKFDGSMAIMCDSLRRESAAAVC